MMDLGQELAALVYAAAALLGWRSRLDEHGARAVSWLLGLGALLQTLAFVGLHLQTPPVPLESFAASLALFAWLITVAYLLSLGIARFRALGAWVALAAAVFTIASETGLRLGPAPPASPEGGVWSHAHVLLSGAGFSLLALASLAGFAYLVKERDLKRKRGPRFLLPSLESLDRVEHMALSLGFPLLTLGVGTGFLWEVGLHRSLWNSHALLMLCAWTVYLFPITLRVFRRQHGPGPARSVVLGFAVLAASYIGIRLLGGWV